MVFLTRAAQVIRGIRTPLRPNTLVGRLSPGLGPAEMLSISEVLTLGVNLGDLEDVVITNPQNLDVLTFESASGKWKNVAP